MDKTYKYIEVYQDIKTKIACNEYVIGQKIPSGSELAIRYGCSNLTVKKGLDMLVKEGVLRRRSGFGTEVLRKPIERSLVSGPNIGLLNVLGEEHVDSKIHSFAIEQPSKKIAETLKISTSDYVYHIVRSRYIDSNPYSIEEIIMPLDLIPHLQPKHLKASIYKYIENELKLTIKTSHIRIRGDKANEFDALVLEIKPEQFIIEIEKIVYLDSGMPFEHSITRHLYNDFEFEAVFVEN